MPQLTENKITDEDIASLRSKFRGRLLTADDSDYSAVRKIHNGMIDRRPGIIAQCAGTADAMRALEIGVRSGATISIRCGGHSVPGFSVCDGGVMIDLSGMTSVYVNAAQRTARAEGGVNWGQFDLETEAFGLATTGGLVRTTGIGGLTLSGGHGFLMRKFGLACDNLLSATVLTADGRILEASVTENPDLYWALRGGGGNFGIVTSFEFRLHELGPVLGGLVAYPFGQAKDVLRFYDDFSASAPDELGVLAALGTLPDGNKAVVHPVCCIGPLAEAERTLEPLRTFSTPLMDNVKAMPYTAVQSIVENFNPRGMRNYWKMVYLNELCEDAINIMIDRYAQSKAPFTHIVIYTLGGQVNRVAPEETAVSYRDARHAVVVIGMWEDPAEDEAHIGWVRELIRALEPFASEGFYPNYEADVAPDRVRAAFGAEKFDRLVQVKQKYDPSNVFRMNQNIRPVGR